MKPCNSCDGKALISNHGNGKCRKCHGTGKVGFGEGFIRSMSNQSQNCKSCHGSGSCSACGGRGYRS